MKLYGTITSERATKGQGGNEYIHVTLKDETQKPKFFIGYWGHTLVVEDTGTGKEVFRLETKGKRQKDELCCKCLDEGIKNYNPCKHDTAKK